MLRLERVVEPDMAEIWLKLEGMNPAGSIKDPDGALDGERRRGAGRP